MIFKNTIKMQKSHLSDGYSLAFLGFFFIFLIAGRKTATAKIENGLTHVFRCLAHLFIEELVIYNIHCVYVQICHHTSLMQSWPQPQFKIITIPQVLLGDWNLTEYADVAPGSYLYICGHYFDKIWLVLNNVITISSGSMFTSFAPKRLHSGWF